jgi:hypothetical protein
MRPIAEDLGVATERVCVIYIKVSFFEVVKSPPVMQNVHLGPLLGKNACHLRLM